MLRKKIRRFLRSSPLRKLQWAIRIEGKRPALSQDVRFIRVKSTRNKNRLDIVGVSGIGKTYFGIRLAKCLGQIGPTTAKEKKSIPDSWGEVFTSFAQRLGKKISSPASNYESLLQQGSFLIDLLELESRLMTNLSFQFTINGESIVRHRLKWFADAALIQPEFISELLKDRLLLLCDADDPVESAIRGRQKRGDNMLDSPQLRKSVEKKIQAIRQSASILAALGIPVLTINLDRPIRDNIAIVGRFLEENHVTSRRIRKWAKRAR